MFCISVDIISSAFNGDFFNFKINLDSGPCINKRLKGCGFGNDYIAVTPNGDIYPCHQLVGEPKFVLENIHNTYTKIFDNNLKKEFELYHDLKIVDNLDDFDEEYKSNLKNDLEFALLDKYDELRYLNSIGLQMSGSGSTFFKVGDFDLKMDENKYLIIKNLRAINSGVEIL